MLTNYNSIYIKRQTNAGM